MNQLEGVKRFYFIGIGGIGMSALARYFFSKGFVVAGYDKTPSPLTDLLQQEGIAIHFDDLGENIPSPYNEVEGTIVVYTPAIPKNFGELVFTQQQHTVYKRSEVLGLITQSSKGIGVAGTHGKTTTSTMLAHVLNQSETKCSAFLGGIATNLNSNVLVHPSAEYTIVEADEFDRSFLRLSPFASIITAMDPDHLDIYGTPEAFYESFQEYANKHVGKVLVYKHNLPLNNTGFQAVTYGLNQSSATVSGADLTAQNGRFLMDITGPFGTWKAVELGLPGIHNAENALAVVAMCYQLGLSEQEIRAGLQSFKGVRRRFEYHVRTSNFVYIDDYAHHPTEIEALVSSVRMMYPNKKITGIFQPHLFSRTQDFFDGFVAELSKLDEVLLLPIYPAREEPIEGVRSDVLVTAIGNKARLVLPEEVVTWAESTDAQVVLTIGAGDIDRIVPKLTAIFERKNHE
jgi:UDP-N-acetylmuramate--alanine ligase